MLLVIVRLRVALAWTVSSPRPGRARAPGPAGPRETRETDRRQAGDSAAYVRNRVSALGRWRPIGHGAVVERQSWVIRLAATLGILGVGWRAAPPPFRALVWSLVGLVIAGITALGVSLGLPVSLRDVVRLGAG